MRLFTTIFKILFIKLMLWCSWIPNFVSLINCKTCLRSKLRSDRFYFHWKCRILLWYIIFVVLCHIILAHGISTNIYLFQEYSNFSSINLSICVLSTLLICHAYLMLKWKMRMDLTKILQIWEYLIRFKQFLYSKIEKPLPSKVF